MDTLRVVDTEIKGDLEFLLSFAPAINASQVEPGLMSMFYVTGSYEGDVELISRVQSIVERYGLDTCFLDDCNH